MSDIRLFRLSKDHVEPIVGTAVALERSLQTLIEAHAEALLGIRFLATEFPTTKSHSGRIDTLGIDESGSPVIIEYKRAVNENVINQGLFYLNWLLDHQADFTLLVLKKLGAAEVETIEWGSPRLICIASDFTKYDQHAIQQMPRNIDLVRYRRYGDDLLLLEQFASSAVEPGASKPGKKLSAPHVVTSIGNELESTPESKLTGLEGRAKCLDKLDQLSPELQDCYQMLRAFAVGLGDGVHEHIKDRYITFRSIKNFAYVHFQPRAKNIRLEVALDDSTVANEAGFVSAQNGKGHWPVIFVANANAEDVERALPLIAQSYRRTYPIMRVGDVEILRVAQNDIRGGVRGRRRM